MSSKPRKPWYRRFWSWAWIGWILIFVVLETVAILDRDRSDTLSEQVWALVTINPGLWGAGIAILLGWLFFHFLIEPRWPKYNPRPKKPPDDDEGG